MQIGSQPLQAPTLTRKGGHPLQNHQEDGLACVCVVTLAAIGAKFAFPAKLTILDNCISIDKIYLLLLLVENYSN